MRSVHHQKEHACSISSTVYTVARIVRMSPSVLFSAAVEYGAGREEEGDRVVRGASGRSRVSAVALWRRRDAVSQGRRPHDESEQRHPPLDPRLIPRGVRGGEQGGRAGHTSSGGGASRPHRHSRVQSSRRRGGLILERARQSEGTRDCACVWPLELICLRAGPSPMVGIVHPRQALKTWSFCPFGRSDTGLSSFDIESSRRQGRAARRTLP